MEDHFHKLRNMYLAAPLHKSYTGIEIEIKEEQSTITLDVTENFHHAGGSMHGSVYFKLLDDAAYFSVQSILTDFFIVTTQFNIQMFRPVVQGQLRAVGHVDQISRQLYVAGSVIYDEKNRKIGMGQGQFMKSNVKLEDVKSYC